ncbi:MAG TPA: alpha/beta fold hydrolase [Thermoanaerobaculia bacterium]|nr:alpha/beta fold hydrolase [Thermoanaerobaculia bacterium]
MHLLAILLAAVLATPALADATEDVRQAEIAFAKAFADRDKAKFFSFVADDAVFLSPVATLRGKQAVIDGWSRYFDGPRAPFAWTPDRVSVSADGTLALSSGPVFDPDGNHAGSFQSTWRRQSDGTWKVIFDGSGPGPVPFQAMPVEEGFVPTPDGVKLFYRKTGRGPVVIVPLDFILHDEVKQFADIATVITYDLRNRGRSTRSSDESTWTIEQDVRDLETVRAYFKAETFLPVGYSYLGKVVMLYAVAHPDRVRRIIQLGPIENRRPAGSQLQVPDFGAAKEDVARWRSMDPAKDPKAYCLAQWNVLRYFHVGDPKKAGGFDVEGACAHENEWPVNVNRHFAKLLANPPILTDEELRSIRVPVLTIHGTTDRAASYEGGRTWVRQLPDARLVTLPGAGHAMWIDDPVTTFAAMRAFLRNEWPPGAHKPAD